MQAGELLTIIELDAGRHRTWRPALLDRSGDVAHGNDGTVRVVSTSPPRVTTATGDVQGATVAAPSGQAVHRFLGIPYAAPPVGDLRWRPPEPPAPWPDVRDATTFAPAAPQRVGLETALPSFAAAGGMSEDCLALNVWTPALDGARPVIVWLHGGAYMSGGTSQPVYDAARLAAEGDVVVVTVAYRLGALGFLAPDGDAAANCGLRDQLAALRWVREHADAFGGDPRRVTVMGESAGAGSILHLLASPRRGNAFDRAVAQSGEPKTLDRDAGATVAAHLGRHVGLDSADASALRAVPVERLLDAQAATMGDLVGKLGLMPFAPVLDGDVCDLPIIDAVAAGRAAQVGVVIGTTRDELALFPDTRAASLDDERLLRRITKLAPAIDPHDVLATYRDRFGASATNERIWDAVRTDAMMRAPNLRVSSALARTTDVFVYRFDWAAPDLGAAHAVDVPFTFGTFDREGWADAIGYDDRAERLGIAWRRAWTNFATTGDPGWSRARADGAPAPTLLFGPDGMEQVDDADDDVVRCWIGR